MDRRSFLKNTGWSFLGLAASGSLLGSCVAGSKEAKKIMPSASNLKVFWGDLHNHCNLTYGHGDMRDAFEAAKGQLDFVSVTPHAMWPDIPGANDPRLKWVIDYHTGAFKRLREGGYEKYVKMSNEYNKEGEFLTFIGYEAHSMEHGDHVALNYDLDAPLVECTSIEDWKEKAKGHKVFVTPHHMGYQGGYRGYNWKCFTEGDITPFVEMYSRHGLAAVTAWRKATRATTRTCTIWVPANGKEPSSTVWSKDINSVSWLPPTSTPATRAATATAASVSWLRH